MVDQLLPKALNVILPGYYGVYYLDAGLCSAIRDLEVSAEVMKHAENDQAYYGIIEAITALKAMQIGLKEIKAENNTELSALHNQAQHEQQSESTSVRFGNVVDDEDDEGGGTEPPSPL